MYGLLADSNGGTGMVDDPGHFVWYELITTDMAAAQAFYTRVVGWDAQDASTPDLAYALLTAGTASVMGLMDLPAEAIRMGATSRWMGYVGVSDINAKVSQIKGLGGTVYVPPTDTNIGRIAVVTDPQMSTFALVEGLKFTPQQPVGMAEPGHIGWHELIAADWETALDFYRELFGWQKAAADIGPADTYQSFSADGQTIGGMVTKRPLQPAPAWLYYINIGDVEPAAERVKAAGGEIFEGPLELADGSSVIRCTDPQGAAFALQGKRSQDGVGWSTAWGEFSSKGKLVQPGR
jgi:uncharacterized protein